MRIAFLKKDAAVGSIRESPLILPTISMILPIRIRPTIKTTIARTIFPPAFVQRSTALLKNSCMVIFPLSLEQLTCRHVNSRRYLFIIPHCRANITEILVFYEVFLWIFIAALIRLLPLMRLPRTLRDLHVTEHRRKARLLRAAGIDPEPDLSAALPHVADPHL